MSLTNNIRILWGFAFLVTFAFPLAGTGKEVSVPEVKDRCLACHVESEILPEGFMKEDVHLKAGLTCAGCHGGNPSTDDEDEAMSAKAGFIGVPEKEDIPEFCGKCHSDIDFMRQYQPRIPTDQLQQYETSIHGKRLRSGDKKVADCASCHTAHNILPAGDSRSSVHALNVPSMCNTCHGDSEHMSGYGIPIDQYKNYVMSVHGKALLENQDVGSPACNDCHGNHGAMPPGITSVRQICGSCHAGNMEFFSKSIMAEAFEERELHGCEECHGYHDVVKTNDDMVGVGEKSVCVDCHEAGDKGYNSAKEIRSMLKKLETAYNRALAKQTEVQRIGMDDVDIVFLLQESHQNMIQAKTLVHTFDPEKLAPQIKEGESRAISALELAYEQVKDYQIRRRGFGIASIFITILLVALFFKIRQIEGK